MTKIAQIQFFNRYIYIFIFPTYSYLIYLFIIFEFPSYLRLNKFLKFIRSQKSNLSMTRCNGKQFARCKLQLLFFFPPRYSQHRIILKYTFCGFFYRWYNTGNIISKNASFKLKIKNLKSNYPA